MSLVRRRARIAAGLAMLLAVPAAPAQTPRNEPIEPLPTSVQLDAARVALGERLFGDSRLSASGQMSCAGCHRLDRAGADGRERSATNSGAPDQINTPTIFNVGFLYRFTWRGAFSSLAEQAASVIANPRHMASTPQAAVARISEDLGYRQGFAQAYPGQGLTPTTLLDALVNYERSLITPNARFDRWLRGEDAALDARELRGYEKFKRFGCIACHQGQMIGGNVFARFGIFTPGPAQRSAAPSGADLGRFMVTGREEDRFVYRVPSLRNVAETAPYLHDGSIARLKDVIDEMAEHQLGRALELEDVDDIHAFLQTLTGEFDGAMVSRR
ncbi:MAG: cytochrome-c peroxidase [Chromatiales bacterium]|nr:cytochrome-c peroxidase [Chromatiales bacterium]